MNIKNYTSSVPVDKSVTLIEHRLVSAGASHIAKIYDGDPKQLKGITFQISINGYPQLFKLPSKSDLVFKVLWQEIRRPRPETKRNVELQALRTSWKILADWVDIQVSMIQLEQAELAEVFLPYHYNPSNDQTLFERVKSTNYKLLNQ